MSKALMKSLKADLPALAEMIRSKGRGRDTMLAHITPREAALLTRKGGSGTINPDTGLPEFDDGAGFDAYAGGTADHHRGPAPASMYRLQRRARPSRSGRASRQADRCPRLCPDHSDLGTRHAGRGIRPGCVRSAMDHL